MRNSLIKKFPLKYKGKNSKQKETQKYNGKIHIIVIRNRNKR